jgi:hypothetical protein
LHGQNSLLERDISKRDSLAGRRRDSIAEKSSKMFDPQRPKGPAFSLVEDLIYVCKKCGYYLLFRTDPFPLHVFYSLLSFPQGTL